MKHLLRQAATLLAGRWQMPLAVCAALAATVALRSLKPPPRVVHFDVLLADLKALEQGGQFVAAADAAANLLKMTPPLPVKQQAVLHDTLADIIYRQELARGAPNLDNAQLVLTHRAAAQQLGHAPTTSDLLQAAQAQEWLGKAREAVETYRGLLARETTPEQRRGALQTLVRLLEEQPGPAAQDERGRYLRDLLAETGVSPTYLWWGLQHLLQDALEAGDEGQAQALVEQYGGRLKSSDTQGYHDYLLAWIDVNAGRYEEAGPLIDWIDDWLQTQSGINRALDESGHLPALNRWLGGQVHLAESRPQAALQAFEEALALYSYGELGDKALLGRGAALCLLERHEAARRLFEEVAQRLEKGPAQRRRAAAFFEKGLLELFNGRYERGDFENAVGYLELAVRLAPAHPADEKLNLLEKLGQTYAQTAEAGSDAERQRFQRRESGRSFEAAAGLAGTDEARHATLLWSAAEQYDEAGLSGDARRMLLRFVAGRAGDSRLPRGLLRLGQAFEADGALEEARVWYERVVQEFPQLEEAAQAKLRNADCLIALGRDHYPEAERLLAGLLEDDHLTPQAAVFRDALFALCDLLYDQGRYGEVIGRLEDFVALYPQDPECVRGRFMLADAYRRSAYGLRGRGAAPAEGPAAAESRARFLRAAALFDDFLRDLSGRAAADESAALYERLSLFYRGDCLFELNEPEALNEALTIYRQAAARYESEPAALSAQVQIANIQLRLGKLTEAARALERARWLVRNIPEQAFAGVGGTDRAAWDRYLAAVSASNLFRDVLGGSQ